MGKSVVVSRPRYFGTSREFSKFRTSMFGSYALALDAGAPEFAGSSAGTVETRAARPQEMRTMIRGGFMGTFCLIWIRSGVLHFFALSVASITFTMFRPEGPPLAGGFSPWIEGAQNASPAEAGRRRR